MLSYLSFSFLGGLRGPQVLDTTILVSKLTGLRALASVQFTRDQCSMLYSIGMGSRLNAIGGHREWDRSKLRYGLHALPYSVQTRRSSEIEMKRGDRSSAPDLR